MISVVNILLVFIVTIEAVIIYDLYFLYYCSYIETELLQNDLVSMTYLLRESKISFDRVLSVLEEHPEVNYFVEVNSPSDTTDNLVIEMMMTRLTFNSDSTLNSVDIFTSKPTANCKLSTVVLKYIISK